MVLQYSTFHTVGDPQDFEKPANIADQQRESHPQKMEADALVGEAGLDRLPPLLKWAGGKRWLAPSLKEEIPSHGTYFEPFAGGAALFFATVPKHAVLADVNPRIINVYEQVRRYPDVVQKHLNEHQKMHCKSYFYEERAKCIMSGSESAARLIYLNRTCWNGLFRLNKSGKFNVPIGTKTQVTFGPNEMRAYSAILKDCILKTADFEEIIDQAVAGDFIFADPPYTVKHNNNGFIKYNESIFSWMDQVRLSKALGRAASRGCMVLSTNANHCSVKSLYAEIAQVQEISRHSVIAGQSKYRTATSELLIRFDRGRG